MSAYPSFLSPIMDATNLIATTALNEEAQLALASAVVANERLDILEPIALKIDSVSGDYTGNRGTNMIINGNIECTELTYVTLNPPISAQTLSQVLTNGSDAGEQNITGLNQLIFKDDQVIFPVSNIYGAGLSLDGCNLQDIGRIDCTSIVAINDITCSTLNYTTLNPPVSGGSETLSQVLTNGNDATSQNIIGVGTLGFTDTQTIIPETTVMGLTLNMNRSSIVANNITCSNISSSDSVVGLSFTATGGASFSEDGTVSGRSCEIVGRIDAAELELTSSFILGGISMDDIGNLTCGQLNYTTLNPPISSGWVGTATSNLDMADYAIQNTPSIGFKNGGEDAILSFDNINGDLDFDTMNLKSISRIECNSVNVTASVSANDIIATGNIDTAYLTVKNPGSGDTVASIDGGGTITSTSLVIADALGTYAQIDSTGAINCTTVNTVSVGFKPTYDYYVAKGGSDSSPYDGSILSPYLTIQAAINKCNLETQNDGVPRVIHVSAGSYSEYLTITNPRISIKGEGVGMHPDVGTSIYGDIVVVITTGNSDLHNNNITISGFLINGSITDNTVDNKPHRLILENCHIYGNDRCLRIYPTCDYRAFVAHCYISNDDTVATNPLVECAGTGMVSFNNNIMVSKGGVQNVFKLADTCRIDLFVQNSLTSDSTSVMGVAAIFNHASTQTISLGMNAFIYTSTYLKQNLGMAAAAVYISNNGSLVIISNTVSLLGMATVEKAYYNTGTGVIIFGNNQSTSSNAGLTATGISGTLNVNKFATTVSS